MTRRFGAAAALSLILPAPAFAADDGEADAQSAAGPGMAEEREASPLDAVAETASETAKAARDLAVQAATAVTGAPDLSRDQGESEAVQRRRPGRGER